MQGEDHVAIDGLAQAPAKVSVSRVIAIGTFHASSETHTAASQSIASCVSEVE